MSVCIGKVQVAEKDKLMYVAAQHMDLLQVTVVTTLSALTGGKTEDQVKYLQDQIRLTESTIAELMENVQCSMCDLTDEEDTTTTKS